VGFWPKGPQTLENQRFFVAIFVFKSGQKVGFWPIFAQNSGSSLPKITTQKPIWSKVLANWPFFKTKSGHENGQNLTPNIPRITTKRKPQNRKNEEEMQAARPPRFNLD